MRARKYALVKYFDDILGTYAVVLLELSFYVGTENIRTFALDFYRVGTKNVFNQFNYSPFKINGRLTSS